MDRATAIRCGALVLAVMVAACSAPGTDSTATTTSTPPTTIPAETTSATPPTTTPSTTLPASPATTGERNTPTVPTTTLPAGVTDRPDWLGSRPLPERADGLGEVGPTPEMLIDRRFATVDVLPPPESDDFEATIEPVGEDVASRSTWSEDCPVKIEDLRYVTTVFWGFDGRPHTGELILHARVAEDVVEVLGELHRARFPIEEMRVTGPDELDLPPTGDGNNTTAFVCRPAVGSTGWSQHAHGLAVDINPFHNPYHRDDAVVPELASAYLDRSDVRPGMIVDDGPAVEAFTEIGWGWGGHWSTLVDYMHFSENGR